MDLLYQIIDGKVDISDPSLANSELADMMDGGIAEQASSEIENLKPADVGDKVEESACSSLTDNAALQLKIEDMSNQNNVMNEVEPAATTEGFATDGSTGNMSVVESSDDQNDLEELESEDSQVVDVVDLLPVRRLLIKFKRPEKKSVMSPNVAAATMRCSYSYTGDNCANAKLESEENKTEKKKKTRKRKPSKTRRSLPDVSVKTSPYFASGLKEATDDAEGVDDVPPEGPEPKVENHDVIVDVEAARDWEKDRENFLRVNILAEEQAQRVLKSAKPSYDAAGRRSWVCPQCDKTYTTKHNLVTHVLDHSGVKRYGCSVCSREFKQLSHLRLHTRTHTKHRPHVCGVCKRSFVQATHLKRHAMTHGNDKKHECLKCGRMFGFPSELKYHLKNVHSAHKNEASPKEEEEKAEEKEDSAAVLSKHLKCKQCGRAFIYRSQLRSHLLTHSGQRPFQCDQCDMSFMKDHHLTSHKLTHSGQKPWPCPSCDKRFNSKANMERHRYIHEGRRFPCLQCGSTFSQPQVLKNHMVTHQAEKPFICKECGKGFSRLHYLKGHLHLHTGNKPFVCECGSTFTVKGNLQRHQKVKGHKDADPNAVFDAKATDEAGEGAEKKPGRKPPRSHLCQCGTEFSTKGNLQRHQKQKGHGDVSDDLAHLHVPVDSQGPPSHDRPTQVHTATGNEVPRTVKESPSSDGESPVTKASLSLLRSVRDLVEEGRGPQVGQALGEEENKAAHILQQLKHNVRQCGTEVATHDGGDEN